MVLPARFFLQAGMPIKIKQVLGEKGFEMRKEDLANEDVSVLERLIVRMTVITCPICNCACDVPDDAEWYDCPDCGTDILNIAVPESED